MSEDEQRVRGTDEAKRWFVRYRYIIIALVVVAVFTFVVLKALFLDPRSIDEQLAAIDAELAIPDEENAAVYYRRFFSDPDNAANLDDLSDHTPSAYRKPWTDDEYPELASKLEKHRVFIQELLDISEMSKARFPVYPEIGSYWWEITKDMRRVLFVLSWAASNDLAESRAAAAFEKYRCQMNFARQLEQQPGYRGYYRNVGIAIEAVALGNIRRAVMRQETTPEQLRSLEKLLEIPIDRIEGHAEIAARVERLIKEKEWSQLPFMTKLKQWWLGPKARREREQRQRRIQLGLESTRKAMMILIALRRHKDKTGAWPERLENIEPRLPDQMLIDPQNDGPFVYRRDANGFLFYSKGPNGIDEHGSSKRPADDWPIWPLDIK